MAYHWQNALAIGAFALYLFILAVWHGGRHPRVVSGPADAALLAFGVGGLVLFGPLGQTLVRTLYLRPGVLGWVSLASAMSLFALLASLRSGRRLVIYNVDAQAIDTVLGEAFAAGPGRFVRTLRGFEDATAARGIAFEALPRLRTATIEAFGRDPEAMIEDLTITLRRRLAPVESPPSRIAWLLLTASALILCVPMAGWVVHEPHTREALRVLFERFSGVRSAP